MVKKLELTVVKDDNDVLDVNWRYENMSYVEALGFLELAKDHMKRKEGSKKSK